MRKLRSNPLLICCLINLTTILPLINASGTKFGVPGRVCAGVNIHFAKGHEQDLDMIAAAGFKFIRMDFVWQEIEHSRGIYDWSAYDELTENLNMRGLRAIYILDYSNSLYEPEVESKDPITGGKQNGIAAPCHPESIAAFAQWAAAAAEHFKESNVVWEIWNEPNITFWMPAPDVAQYNVLALATCKAIRSFVPGAVIIGPATSQIPLPFIESFLASGILEYLDGVSVHPYREYSKSPETAMADYRKVSDLIARYAPAGKAEIPLISSEWGYASATKGISTKNQAEFIVRMQLTNVMYGIPVSIWYDWKNDGTEPGNFEHNCGTVTFDLKPKPAYDAVKIMNAELNGFTFLHRIDTGNENDYLLLFKDSINQYKIAAWTTDSPHYVTIDNTIQNIKGVIIRDGRGNSMKTKSEKGSLVLNLMELPQYISIPGRSITR
jgi:polysaccharide biosynthesis protein PslG